MSDVTEEEHPSASVVGDYAASPAVVQTLSETSDFTQVVDLTEYSVFQISGSKAADFLQGQFCNDLSQVSSTRAQITGYCTPKGRLIALPFIVGCESGFRMVVERSVKEAFIKRLRLFIMRDDVQIDELEDWRCFGIIADSMESVGALDKVLGALPVAPLDVATTTSQQIIKWHEEHLGTRRSRYLLVGQALHLENLWSQTTDIATQGPARWRLGDISAALPSISEGVREAFVPQMINLQLIDGLSFTKGCYPGQEIVARMQYLGKLKRHMRIFHLPLPVGGFDSFPSAGASLGADGGPDAGIIVDAVQHAEEHIAILAVVKVSTNDQVLDFEGHELQAVDLPYALPSLSDESQSGVLCR